MDLTLAITPAALATLEQLSDLGFGPKSLCSPGCLSVSAATATGVAAVWLQRWARTPTPPLWHLVDGRDVVDLVVDVDVQVLAALKHYMRETGRPAAMVAAAAVVQRAAQLHH